MKSLVTWFARNPVAANFLMWLMLVAGFVSWFQMRKEIFPETELNMVLISVPYPNASPEEVEKGRGHPGRGGDPGSQRREAGQLVGR